MNKLFRSRTDIFCNTIKLILLISSFTLCFFIWGYMPLIILLANDVLFVILGNPFWNFTGLVVDCISSSGFESLCWTTYCEDWISSSSIRSSTKPSSPSEALSSTSDYSEEAEDEISLLDSMMASLEIPSSINLYINAGYLYGFPNGLSALDLCSKFSVFMKYSKWATI